MSSLDYLTGSKEIPKQRMGKQGVHPNTKANASFSVRVGVLERFREHCESQGYYMSFVVERLIKKWLDEQEDDSS